MRNKELGFLRGVGTKRLRKPSSLFRICRTLRRYRDSIFGTQLSGALVGCGLHFQLVLGESNFQFMPISSLLLLLWLAF